MGAQDVSYQRRVGGTLAGDDDHFRLERVYLRQGIPGHRVRTEHQHRTASFEDSLNAPDQQSGASEESHSWWSHALPSSRSG